MEEEYRMTPLGDGALLIHLGNRIDDALNTNVIGLFQQLQQAVPFITDVVPGYSSIAIYYDVLSLHTNEKPAYEHMQELLLPFLKQKNDREVSGGRTIAIPVCYAKNYAPDLEEMAAQKGMSADELIFLHTAKAYRVYMIGFLPGFPYMGKVDERLATPRKSNPRTLIPAGSVGIAGEQTGIYPLASPGGWNIIGRTPVLLFDKHNPAPVLLQPGDSVTFHSITEDEFENYQSRTP